MHLDKTSLSLPARLGSGSACRSLWNGLVKWNKGQREDGLDSYAEPLPELWEELYVGLLICQKDPKFMSSRAAMQQTSATSSFYPLWIEKIQEDLESVETAFKAKDFDVFGQGVERNALAMHATMLTSWPPIVYSTHKTLLLYQQVWNLRKKGVPVYFTQDAGPNLKIFFLSSELGKILESFPQVEVIKPFDNTLEMAA